MDDFINQPKPRQDARPQPKRKSWLRRILVALVLLAVVCVGGFFWMVQKTRTNPPYSTALVLIEKDPQLIQELGTPIRDLRWLPTSGYPAQFQMQVAGPRGKADISVTAGRFEGKWELTAVDVLIREGGKRFSLNTGSQGAAPTWNPGGSAAQGGDSGDAGLAPPIGLDSGTSGGGPPGVKIELPEASPDMNIQLPPVPPAPEAPKP